jgi:adenosylmethionine-8-amino-7-oxononanoate aminotransferase
MEHDHQSLRLHDRQTLWHAFSQMQDYDGLIIQSGRGNYLIDINGKSYLDGVSSMWCNVHGHCHPYMNAAIQKQLAQIAHVTLLGQSSPNVITLASRLCSIAPTGLKHAFFASDGSAAVEAAMKMAFQYWRQSQNASMDRNLFLAVSNAYHGDTIGSLAVGGVSRFQSVFQPLLFPVIQGPSPCCNRSDRCDDDLLQQTLAIYDRLLQENAGKVAAIIVEPLVQFAAGIVFHPQGFLKGLRELADRHDTLLIADEIAVGMGKTGRMFACEHESVTPDLLCLGKGLTGGYLPLSAVLVNDRIWDAFLGEFSQSKTFYHGHTFGGNPLAAAAAHATLDLFESERTLDAVKDNSIYLSGLLNELNDLPNVANPRVFGMIAAFDLVVDNRTMQQFPADQRRGAQLCRELLQHGIWMRPLRDTIVIVPPLSVTKEQLRHIVESIRTCLTYPSAPSATEQVDYF